MPTDATLPPSLSADRPAWGAVLSMSLGVFALVTAEFLPASLLTPLADGLGVSKGAAGQAVTATALVGLVSSLLIAIITRGIDRRHVLIGLSILMIASNIAVALASGLPMLLAGRVLLGVALGGFWSLSTATMMRLVPEASIPRAFAIMFMGLSAATVVAVPVGSYLGAAIGWRGVFWAAAALGAVALLVQVATLPALPSLGRARLSTLAAVMARPGVGLGMVAVLLVFAGHFTFFTYIRPFLETVTGVSVEGITAILFAFGLANFLGTYLVASLIRRSLSRTLAFLPAGLAGLALLLSAAGGTVATDTVMITLWGLIFAGVPVAWSTWITRALPDEAEAGGGLLVAAINFAIALGAGLGGLVLDLSGPVAVFVMSGIILALAATLIALKMREL